jgi:hypothetical protein
MLNRLLTIISSPLKLGEVSEKRPWVDVAALSLIIALIAGILVAPISHRDGLKMLEKTRPEQVEKLKELGKWDDIVNTSPRTLAIRTGISIGIFYLFGLVITSLLLFLVMKLFAAEINFKDVFFAYTHATFLNYGIGSALRALLILSKKTIIGVTTSIALFIPGLSPFSKTYTILQNFDLFDIWTAVAAGLAIAGLAKVEAKKGVIASLFVWLIKAGLISLPLLFF